MPVLGASGGGPAEGDREPPGSLGLDLEKPSPKPGKLRSARTGTQYLPLFGGQLQVPSTQGPPASAALSNMTATPGTAAQSRMPSPGSGHSPTFSLATVCLRQTRQTSRATTSALDLVV